MNRRDLLKMIGIGGVGAVANVASGKEVEAAPAAEAKVVVAEPSLEETVSYLNALYGGESVIIGSASFYPMETAAYWELDVDRAELFDFGGDE
jgi:hypothetical protein